VGCEVSWAKCEERKECGEMGSVKREGGGSVKRRESENLPYSSMYNSFVQY
jgi:hypothetical protein